MTRRIRLGLSALGLVLAACGGDGPNPSTAGDLLVTYFQSGPEPGAVLLTITGGPVETVTALGGQQVSFASPLTGTTNVVLAGTLVNGDVLRLRVPDVSLAADYRVRVIQAADKTTFALLDPARYMFTVHK